MGAIDAPHPYDQSNRFLSGWACLESLVERGAALSFSTAAHGQIDSTPGRRARSFSSHRASQRPQGIKPIEPDQLTPLFHRSRIPNRRIRPPFLRIRRAAGPLALRFDGQRRRASEHRQTPAAPRLLRTSGGAPIDSGTFKGRRRCLGVGLDVCGVAGRGRAGRAVALLPGGGANAAGHGRHHHGPCPTSPRAIQRGSESPAPTHGLSPTHDGPLHLYFLPLQVRRCALRRRQHRGGHVDRQ